MIITLAASLNWQRKTTDNCHLVICFVWLSTYGVTVDGSYLLCWVSTDWTAVLFFSLGYKGPIWFAFHKNNYWNKWRCPKIGSRSEELWLCFLQRESPEGQLSLHSCFVCMTGQISLCPFVSYGNLQNWSQQGSFPRVSVLRVLYTNKEESFVTWQDQTFSPIVLEGIQSQRRVWSSQSFNQPTSEDCGSFPSSHDMVYLNPPHTWHLSYWNS
jgi:hypothetical protein